MAAAQQRAPACGVYLRYQLAHESGLADARLTDEGDHPAPPPAGLGDGRSQAGHLLASPDERRVHGHREVRGALELERRGALGRVRGGRCRLPTQDPLVELPGFLLRFHSELALKDCHARLVLLESRPPASPLGVEAHEAAVHGFLERVESDQPQRCLERVPGGSRRPALLSEQPGQRLDRQLSQSRALGHQPVLEERAAEGKTLHEVTPVERHSPRERPRIPRLCQVLESAGVDVDPVRVQGHGLAGQGQARRIRCGQGSAEGEQGLPEATARLGL